MFTQDYKEKITRRLYRYTKRVVCLATKPHPNTQPIFIMGCGRSGTTMLVNIFHRDLRIESLGENDLRIANNYMLINSNTLCHLIESSRFPVLVLKPILNSFDALDLLNKYPSSKIVWLLRNHRDMVSSSIKKFGCIVSDYIRNFILFNSGNNWVSAGLPMDTCKKLVTMNSSNFNDNDWMALVWWSVNRTILLDKLYEKERFLLLKYESLVREPVAALKKIYSFIGVKYNNNAAKYVHPASIGKGSSINLHPDVDVLCSDLAQTLNKISFK